MLYFHNARNINIFLHYIFYCKVRAKMKKTIYIVLGLIVLGLLFFLINNSKDKNVSQSQRIVKKHEDSVSKPFSVLEKKQSHVLGNSIIDGQVKKPLEKKKIFQNVVLPEAVDDTLLVKEREEMVFSKFRNTLPKMLENMKKIPQCLENAEKIEEAFNCYESVDTMHQELSEILGIYEGDYNDSSTNVVWDNETKLKMMDELQEEISFMNEAQVCIEGISTGSELEECLHIEKN